MITIPKEEVPKIVIVGNNIPKMENSKELTHTSIIIEFPHQFRGTDREDTTLSDGFPVKEVEGFIHACLEKYMMAGKRLKLQKSLKETQEQVLKHTNPLIYYIDKIVEFTPSDNIPADELVTPNNLAEQIEDLSNIDGVTIPRDPKGMVNKRRFLQAIRELFGLGKEYTSTMEYVEKNKIRCYPHLIWK